MQWFPMATELPLADGKTIETEPEHEMEKVLFAADELTGLIWAAALIASVKKHQGHGTEIPQKEI